MSRRLHYIDWLRVLAVLLLFPFHTSRVFNAGEPFYVKSPDLFVSVNYVIGFIDMWHMPLLFLLAGASAYFSFARRTAGQFAAERFSRLFVPLIFGIFVIMPPQTYIGGRFNSGYTGSVLEYITSLEFLRWNVQEAGDYYGGFGIGHLWFILFLLLISLVALPFLAWGRSERGNIRVSRWARRLGRPAWWLLPPVFLFFAEAMPEIAGKNIVFDLVLFVLGYIVVADDAFAESAEKFAAIALIAGTALCLGYMATGALRDSLPDPSWALTANNYLGMLGIWVMLIGMLGAGKRFLDAPSPTLSYLAEASYPLYIFHQTVIVVLAWFLITTPLPGVAQWLALLVGSLAVTLALYEGVRRVSVLRVLFGMRPAR